ncbi:hypothetical protein KVT40_005764 [Elsinoe batatas]|uniref:Uncharacterized protein n=1 Tax=Elsinoe batatas TaxID=2601811 RepID=A0A8K0PIN3_9PEZI|nr:hypothetical protein KVT40_005764 [Elsinoe batatas]
MASIYQSFLRAPRIEQLAANASIHYITTTTTILKPDAIIKHLEVQSRAVEKKEEKILNVTEASNGLCIETETILQFRNGGGVILPGMDINMLADMTVVCPMVHVVTLDSDGKIAQIRLYWDQATMLKQVEAIGKTGRNWPIRDGKAQVKLVQDSIKTPGQAAAGAQSDIALRTTSGRVEEDYTKRLFATAEEPERSRSTSGVAPRESAKPGQRQWGELFVSEQTAGDAVSDIGSPNVRSPYQPVLKAGAGKNYTSNRLFDEKDGTQRERSPERKHVDPNRYDHFEFGAGDEVPSKLNKALGLAGKKQTSNWDFEGFATPAKHVPKPQKEHERHFGYGIDDDDNTPQKRNPTHLPRPDAKTNFEMTEDISPHKGPLSTKTNINTSRRHDDYDAQFQMKNASSPAGENAPKPRSNTNAALKPRDDMRSNWSLAEMGSDDAPGIQNKKIYKTAGDGMGGRAGTRFWDVSADDAPENYGGKGGQKQVYKTAGNGMGGRKGHGLEWSIGDPDAM